MQLKVKTQHLLHLVLNAAKSTTTALELAHIRENKGHYVLPVFFESCQLLRGVLVRNAFFQKLIQLSIEADDKIN